MKRNKLIQCIALLSLLSVFFLQSCDWVTTSKLLINNRTKDDIILYFFKSDSVISTIVNDSYSKEGDNIIDVKNGLLLVNNTLSIVESHKNFGPPVPYNPFYRYDSIEIVNNSNQHKTIISKEDFKIFKNGKHNFIYFYEYMY